MPLPRATYDLDGQVAGGLVPARWRRIPVRVVDGHVVTA
jgi:hypothetical protein